MICEDDIKLKDLMDFDPMEFDPLRFTTTIRPHLKRPKKQSTLSHPHTTLFRALRYAIAYGKRVPYDPSQSHGGDGSTCT